MDRNFELSLLLEVWDGGQGGSKWIGQRRESLEDCWKEGDCDVYHVHDDDHDDIDVHDDCDYCEQSDNYTYDVYTCNFKM